MIKNPTISLDPNSEERISALNTIKYTLMLDYTPIDLNNSNNIIPDLFQNTHNCCRDLFHPNGTKFAYDFFGDTYPDNTESLLYLTYEPQYIRKTKEIDFKDTTLSQMILQNCIFKSYHAVIMDLFSEVPVTTYALDSRIGENGIHRLIKLKEIQYNNKKVNTFPKACYGKGSGNSSSAADYRSKLESRISNYEDYFGFLKTTINKTTRYSLPTSNLCGQLSSLTVSQLSRLFKFSNSNCNIYEFSTNLENLHEKLFPDITNKTKENIIDTLYMYYLNEQVFGINLLYTLLKSIHKEESKSNYRFTDDKTLKSICSYKNLTNSFSRQIMLMFAFDHIDRSNSYRDFWNHHDLQYRDDSSGIKKYFTRTHPNGFHFNKWVEQLSLFSNYLSKFIMPIYEWVFINMLMEHIEHQHPNKSHTEHLFTAMELLSDYIYNDRTDILNTIKWTGNADMISVSSTKDMSFINNSFSIKELKMILKEYYSSCDINLNLSVIGPDYFKKNHNRKHGDNFNDIQNFYIDLLRYDHFLN